ncbi:hypothetical protein [Aeromonas salmonicida]|nr:hypothetical protein [Aeromonas salmonicida]MDM5115487.1 hypothetical protein [Aeromonas salmonicida]
MKHLAIVDIHNGPAPAQTGRWGYVSAMAAQSLVALFYSQQR